MARTIVHSPFAKALACSVLTVLVLSSVTVGQSDTFAVVSPWVVAVIQPEGKVDSVGSGFVSSSGYVITAAHVIDSERLPIFLATQGELTQDRLRPAKLVHIDRDSDLAILDAGYSPPVGLLGQQTPALPGDEVWIFGYEFHGRLAVLRIARGSVGQRFQDLFQLDGAIQPGFSGGPITTRGGRVVGITDLSSRRNPNLAYMVPFKLIEGAVTALAPRTPSSEVATGPIIPALPQSQVLPSTVIRDTTVVPGQRLGPLTFATSLSQMNSILGSAPDTTADAANSGHSYTWKRYGVMAFLDAGGTPTMLATWNPAFSTPQGLRVGTSIDAVERAYGLNYQTQWAQDQSVYSVIYPNGITFLVSPSSRVVVAIAIGRPPIASGQSTGQGVSALTGTYIGNYTATAQPGAVYEGVFQITQNGNTIVGTITTNSGRSGNIVGVVAGTRINATMTFTDRCGGQASAIIDVTAGGAKLVGNYTATDCIGTYSGGFVLNRQ